MDFPLQESHPASEKSSLVLLHCYHTDEELTSSIEEFAYGWYNHGRPHSYNDYRTSYVHNTHLSD